MKQTENSRKNRETNRKITDAFFSLMKSKPWDNVTVIELCRHADITRGTFYNYYESIYELMENIENNLLDDLTSRISKARCHMKESGMQEHSYYIKDLIAPHPFMYVWVDYTEEHYIELARLLNEDYGSSHFVNRLRLILYDEIRKMMIEDGMPENSLRNHYANVYIEIFLLVSKFPTKTTGGTYLDKQELLFMLNATRIGGRYNLCPDRWNHPDKVFPDDERAEDASKKSNS